MKQLSVILVAFLIASCNTNADINCDDPIKAKYDRFISYNDFQAHAFKAESMLYLQSSESFVEGETYLLCISGDRIIDSAK